ncbi:mavicyanin-like [Lolium perenne]|uniref:mavicyanin-like n=1 Tax=Lolium perenne TaxID=4522 RepID=UPI0021EA803D|nr:mavicyanin-like [Lolium perenne]
MAMVKAILLAVVAVAALAQLATAVDHPVGGSGVKWTTSGGYDAWSGAQKFTTKDSLVFDYSSSHDVVEVSKAGYDACSASGAVATYTGGKTTIKLTTAGKRYFICGIPGHCTAGMKLAVNVVAAAATPATPAKPRGQRSVAPVAAPAPAPAPVGSTTDEQLPNVSSPTGSTPSSAATIGAKAAVAIAMGMAVVFAM